jgi:hypothetical protein
MLRSPPRSADSRLPKKSSWSKKSGIKWRHHRKPCPSPSGTVPSWTAVSTRTSPTPVGHGVKSAMNCFVGNFCRCFRSAPLLPLMRTSSKPTIGMNSSHPVSAKNSFALLTQPSPSSPAIRLFSAPSTVICAEYQRSGFPTLFTTNAQIPAPLGSWLSCTPRWIRIVSNHGCPE